MSECSLTPACRGSVIGHALVGIGIDRGDRDVGPAILRQLRTGVEGQDRAEDAARGAADRMAEVAVAERLADEAAAETAERAAEEAAQDALRGKLRRGFERQDVL